MDHPSRIAPDDPAELARCGVTHSLCARDSTLYFEQDAEFNQVLQAFRDEHQPVGPTEDYLVQQLAALYWKTRRLGRMEVGLLHHQLDMESIVMPALKLNYKTGETPPMGAIHDWRTELLGRALHSDCSTGNALLKLTLCEAISDRMFHRTLRHLQDHRSRRARQIATTKLH